MKIIKNEFPASFSPSEQLSHVAMGSDKVGTLKPVQVELRLNTAIVAASNFCGQGLTSEDASFIVQAINKKCQINYRHFGIEEICLAIDKGVSQEFGEHKHFPIISAMNILEWIRIYSDTLRKETLHKQRKEEDKQEEADKLIKKASGELKIQSEIILTFHQFCAGKDLEEILSYTPFPVALMALHYEFMDKRGMINMPVSDKNILMSLAKEEIEGLKPDRHDQQEWNIFATTKESQILQLAKSKALKFIFLQWKDEGRELKF